MTERRNYKIGVISDTHIRYGSRNLPTTIYKIFEDVNLIVHCGDLLIQDVIDDLEQIAPVVAVAGNMDSYNMKHVFKSNKIIEIGGMKIGITHGNTRGENAWMSAYSCFENAKLDCLLFGHTHSPLIKEVDGMLIVNPGSAMEKRYEKHHTVAMLDIENSKISARIINLD